MKRKFTKYPSKITASTFLDDGVFDITFASQVSYGEFSAVYTKEANSVEDAANKIYEGLKDGFDVFVSSYDYEIADGDIFFDHEDFKILDVDNIQKEILHYLM